MIEKTCDNCSRLYSSSTYSIDTGKIVHKYSCTNHATDRVKPTEICEYHSYSCNKCSTEGEFIYNDKIYCLECLFDDLCIESYSTISYYQDGEYLGTDDDINEVLENLNEDITML